jgi:ribbon-helix-helix CopG family protein
MHQTTLRLSPDLWEALDQESARLGVSVAQYLREAAIARLAYSAGREGDPDYEAALARAGVPAPKGRRDAAADQGPDRSITETLSDILESLSALAAQSDLARKRSIELRERAAAVRAQRHRPEEE